MLIAGEWGLCADGVQRPIIRGDVQATDGTWVDTPFMVDTGADCTVFHAGTVLNLALPPVAVPRHVIGVGGRSGSIVVDTKIRLFREDGTEVLFRGEYTAMTDPAALDMSVLGRDITNLFALIVDRPGNCVCLLHPRHSYSIQAA